MRWFAKKPAPAPVELSEEDTFLRLRREPFEYVKEQISTLHDIVIHVEWGRAWNFRENELEFKRWNILKFVGYRAIYRRQLIDYDPPLRRQLNERLEKYGWTLEDYADQVYKDALESQKPGNPYDLSFWSAVLGVVTGLIGTGSLLYMITGSLAVSVAAVLIATLVAINRTCTNAG